MQAPKRLRCGVRRGAGGPLAANTQSTRDSSGGGIVTLKLVFPLLDRYNDAATGLGFLLATGGEPSLGRWVAAPSTVLNVTVPPATTLWEAYVPPDGWRSGENSLNHVMFAGAGGWVVRTVAGLSRAPGSRSWRQLVLRPARGEAVWAMLRNASASLDTPMGLAAVSWSAGEASGDYYALNATIPCGASATIVVATRGAAANATVREGGAVVWQGNAFVPGVAGVSGAEAGADGASVEFATGSGSYAFSVAAASGVKQA